MNIDTLTMPRAEARAAFLEYRAAVQARHSAEDEAIMLGYRALARGQQVIDLHDALRGAGLDEQGRPRLAIVRADAEVCYFERHYMRFCVSLWTQSHHRRSYVQLPENLWPRERLTPRDCRAIVPPVPPRFRPVGALSRYHILWEAEWQDVPTDPLLLRHLAGGLYAVLAQWDLTAIERAVLRGRLGRQS